MPFSLEIEPPPPEIRDQATRLAGEAGLSRETWDQPVGELDPVARVRLRIARALALNPSIVLFEHTSATLPRPDVVAFGHEIRALAERRAVAVIALTMDQEFAAAVAAKVLTLDGATGRVTQGRSGRLRFWS